MAGNTLTASPAEHRVHLRLNGTTGAWTFTLVDQLDHPTLNGLPGDNTENDLAINLSSILHATDFDGDTVTAAANALIVTVDDDTPTASTRRSRQRSDDEDGVPAASPAAPATWPAGRPVATGSVAPLFNPAPTSR